MLDSTRSKPTAALYAGVDGCRGGWLVVIARWAKNSRLGDLQQIVARPDFSQVLNLVSACSQVCVDMPIGLFDRAQVGGRPCDISARRLLPRGRKSSIFSPPARAALYATEYRDAVARNGMGMSKESFNILPKIRDLDRVITPVLQARCREAHPELAFQRRLGIPLKHAKRTAAGAEERQAILRRIYRHADLRRALEHAAPVPLRVAADDVRDALILVSVARDIDRGRSECAGAAEPKDSRGLSMQIWF
jgi:predicted RNase H-like nuclease